MNEFLPFAHAAHAAYPPQPLNPWEILLFLALIVAAIMLLLHFAMRKVVSKRMLDRQARKRNQIDDR